MMLRLAQVLGAAFKRALIAGSPQHVAHGFRIVLVAGYVDPGEVLARMNVVLRMLAADPVSFRRAQRELNWIVVVTGPVGTYWPLVRACAIGAEILLTQPPEWVASMVVHEACHARTERYYKHDRSRREMLCANRQLRFLMHLPDTEALSEGLKSHMRTGAWYSAHQRRVIALERLRALNAPGWVLRWAERKVEKADPR